MWAYAPGPDLLVRKVQRVLDRTPPTSDSKERPPRADGRLGDAETRPPVESDGPQHGELSRTSRLDLMKFADRGLVYRQ